MSYYMMPQADPTFSRFLRQKFGFLQLHKYQEDLIAQMMFKDLLKTTCIKCNRSYKDFPTFADFFNHFLDCEFVKDKNWGEAFLKKYLNRPSKFCVPMTQNLIDMKIKLLVDHQKSVGVGFNFSNSRMNGKNTVHAALRGLSSSAIYYDDAWEDK